MPRDLLRALDEENKLKRGAVERYIYLRYGETQETISSILAAIEVASPEDFQLKALLQLFVAKKGLRRSIDKAYEIVAYALFETIVVALNATVSISIPARSQDLLKEFSKLAQVLLGLKEGEFSWEQPAHIYRVGVTNAADRGLDMWANFGPAIQVKHLALDEKRAVHIVDQVESDHLVIVCRDADAKVIETIARQISWGRRVRGIVRESDLIEWYEKCLRGRYATQLGKTLLDEVMNGFKEEFPLSAALPDFLAERGYDRITPSPLWTTQTDTTIAKRKK